MNRLPTLIAVALAFFSGLFVFASYFWGLSFLASTSQFLLKTVVFVSGVALLLAALNLARRHVRRLQNRDWGSWLLVGGFGVAFAAGMTPGGFQTGAGRWLYHWLLAPGMAAVFALLPIFLAYALFRHLTLRDFGGFLLFVGMVVVLLGQMPSLAAQFPLLAELRRDILIGPGAAVFRGVILGLSIGVVSAILLKLFASLNSASLSTPDKREDLS